MTEPADPFELLRQLNPVHRDEVAHAASTEEAQQAFEAIIAGARTPYSKGLRRVRLPRLRRRTYLLALVPLAGAIAAGAWALTHGATTQFTIGCYARADLAANTVVVAAEAGSPVASCNSVWKRGDFGNVPPPPLQACVLPSGAIGVFPSPTGAACRRLKLASLAQTTTTPAREHGSPVQLKNALVRQFLTDRCMNERRAIRTVQAAIQRFGLSDWQVQSNGSFSSRRPCASLAFDEEQHRVLLVPMPRQP